MKRLLTTLIILSCLFLSNGCSHIQNLGRSDHSERSQAESFAPNNTVSISDDNLSVSQSKNTDVSETPQKDQIEIGSPSIEQSLSAFPADGIPVLMYHSISTIPGNNLGVPVAQFIEEMKWLKSRNYSALSLEEFHQALIHEKPVPIKPILITFDDGYLDNYQDAWPILQENGFRATFFIITDSVGPGMMNWEQIRVLADQGNSIGSHTRTHPDLTILSSNQLEKELALSKKEIESYVGRNINALCFPSGNYNDKTLEIMPRLGYKLGFTTKSGKVHLGDNPLALKRVRIPGGMSFDAFKSLFP
ncbi:MAG TPA: polysaccharide deacetylase family protein [Desulfitobacterium dehalogenans]|uniref:Polysaccharide deacetylase family protein n=1 Tax=Desulfitobacterium dehalogenans TaxID=36854 RepID=A0A7C6Z6L5_9FIRM|nr:polysaccharide deacetylase family protein [Desulfitobacterium dehalogenans]